jgi:hypothetical protein
MFKLFNRHGCKSLQEVQDFLRDLPFVNQGGCGLSALAMYRWLKKHGMAGRKTCFYLLNDTASLHRNNKKYLSNKGGQPCACGHAVLHYKGRYYDCHGEYDIKKYKYRLKIDERFMVEALNNLSSWNSDFPRDLLQPRIEKKLGISLADVVSEEPLCFEN